ncbi:MAG: hypothetical protein KGR26_06390 [Cyanobacteria bacterium REEB65]|nr:hypothetical protein [Cyanobacteria bacterium REEB65]
MAAWRQAFRRLGSVFLAALLAACASFSRSPAPANVGTGFASAPPLAGSVDLGFRYRIQAAIGDVAVAASVSFIQPASGSTPATAIATALTNSSGDFVINFTNWAPTAGQVYYLEAFKGLNGNQADADAARLRTLVEFSGGTWQSLTGGTIFLNLATTAVSTAAQLDADQGQTVTLSGLMNGLNNTADASGSPATLTGTGAGVSVADYDEAYQVVDAALGANEDPLASIAKANGAFALLQGRGGNALGIAPGVGADLGDTVTISANASLSFDPSPANDQVSFDGVPAQVTGVSADLRQLTAVVPEGAVRGPVYVVAPAMPRGSIPDYPIYGTLDVLLQGIPGGSATASCTLTPPAGGGSPVTQTVANPGQTASFTFKSLIPGAGWTVSGQAQNGAGTVWASSTEIQGATSSITLVPSPVAGPYAVNSGINDWALALQIGTLSGSATGSF